MRFILTAMSLSILLACSRDDAARMPTAPERPVLPKQPASSLTWVWGMAIDESGVCVVGVTATVVRGQGVGQSTAQAIPCGAWDYDGGFIFKDLTPGVAMTVRASAPGYTLQEKTLVPSSGPQTVVLFALTPIP